MKQKTNTMFLKSLLVLSSLLVIGVVTFSAKTASAISLCLNNNTGPYANRNVTDCSDVESRLPAGTLKDGACYYITDAGGSSSKATATECNKPPFNGFACTIVTKDNPVPCKPDTAANGCVTAASTDTSTGCGLVDKYIQPLINVLAGAVGLIVTIVIIVGGLQYSSAGGDAQKVMAARQKIANAVIALITFGLLYAALQWLIPGGFLHG